MFDDDKFAVWKFHMEIYFEDKAIIRYVDGTVLKPADNAPKDEKEAWNKANTTTKKMISSSVTFQVLENLVNYPTAACMWATLCAFYQQKSKENIYMVQNSFFEYKMSPGDSINTHVNKGLSMGNLLKDLGQPVPKEMLITKIICSLPPPYNSIVAAWTNVHVADQNVASLKVRLLQMENLLALQGGNTSGDSAFFTRSNKMTLHHKQSQHEQNKHYIKDLKGRTRCYNCGESDHWTAECPHPRRDRAKFSNHKQSHSECQHKHTRGHRSEACVATTDSLIHVQLILTKTLVIQIMTLVRLWWLADDHMLYVSTSTSKHGSPIPVPQST